MTDIADGIIDYEQLTGDLIAPLTNDVMFRFLMQYDDRVLRGLVSAFLRISYDEIEDIKILNPINLADRLNAKQHFLDLKLELNYHRIMNIEMQVHCEKNWPERSLSYLCRNFDNVNKGEDYLDVKPVIHIGILDFTLFNDHPEFYGEYKMQNIRDGHLYTDKFGLNILNLKRIDLATEIDKKYALDEWARLFKSTTWEEIKMLAQKNEHMKDSVDSMARYCADVRARWMIEAREEAIRIRNTEERYKRQLEEQLKVSNEQLKVSNEQLKASNEQLKVSNEQLKASNEEITKLKSEIERLKAEKSHYLV